MTRRWRTSWRGLRIRVVYRNGSTGKCARLYSNGKRLDEVVGCRALLSDALLLGAAVQYEGQDSKLLAVISQTVSPSLRGPSCHIYADDQLVGGDVQALLMVGTPQEWRASARPNLSRLFTFALAGALGILVAVVPFTIVHPGINLWWVAVGGAVFGLVSGASRSLQAARLAAVATRKLSASSRSAQPTRER